MLAANSLFLSLTPIPDKIKKPVRKAGLYEKENDNLKPKT